MLQESGIGKTVSSRIYKEIRHQFDFARVANVGSKMQRSSRRSPSTTSRCVGKGCPCAAFPFPRLCGGLRTAGGLGSQHGCVDFTTGSWRPCTSETTSLCAGPSAKAVRSCGAGGLGKCAQARHGRHPGGPPRLGTGAVLGYTTSVSIADASSEMEKAA